jgi:hypothetical protein
MQSIALSPRTNESIRFFPKGPVVIKDALVQTEIEPESAEEPFITTGPYDNFKIDKVQSQPLEEKQPSFDFLKRPEFKDWSDCTIFYSIFQKTRKTLLKQNKIS